MGKIGVKLHNFFMTLKRMKTKFIDVQSNADNIGIAI